MEDFKIKVFFYWVKILGKIRKIMEIGMVFEYINE